MRFNRNESIIGSLKNGLACASSSIPLLQQSTFYLFACRFYNWNTRAYRGIKGHGDSTIFPLANIILRHACASIIVDNIVRFTDNISKTHLNIAFAYIFIPYLRIAANERWWIYTSTSAKETIPIFPFRTNLRSAFW
jgi:hypothetical protein